MVYMIYILFLFLLLSFLLVFLILSEFVAFLRTRVPFVPTHAGDIRFIVEKLGISPSDNFYDLGSGNGKVVFLVNKLSGASCVGFELGWWTYAFSRLKSKFKYKNVKFKMQDFFKADWSKANIIYCYLYPPLMGRIEEKFRAELKPGSIAIVRDFPFPNMPYAEKYYLPKEHEIYIYRL